MLEFFSKFFLVVLLLRIHHHLGFPLFLDRVRFLAVQISQKIANAWLPWPRLAVHDVARWLVTGIDLAIFRDVTLAEAQVDLCEIRLPELPLRLGSGGTDAICNLVNFDVVFVFHGLVGRLVAGCPVV